MEEKYKPIKPADVYYGFIEDEEYAIGLWSGKVINEYGNCDSGNNFIDLFAALVRKYGHLPVKSYAAKMGVKPRHFSGAIIAMTGMEAREWISEYLNLAACELIEKTDWSLTEIARKLNFSPVAFTRFFYAMNKCQPYEWLMQKRHQKKKTYHRY